MKLTTILISLSLLLASPETVCAGTGGNTGSNWKPQIGPPVVSFAGLKPGRPLRRALKPSETDSYTVEAIAGNYLPIAVEQFGIDVVVVVSSPSGHVLVRADSPNGSSGPEPSSLVCPETGTYQINVSAFENAKSAGDYSISVGKQHVANQRDRRTVLAQSSLFSATQLRHGDKQALLRGVQLLDQTSPVWSVSEARRERQVFESLLREELTSLSSIELSTGELHQALYHATRVVRLAHSSHDVAAEGTAREELGKVLGALGRTKLSRIQYLRGLELDKSSLHHLIRMRDYRRAGLRANEIGVTYLELHAYRLAVEAYSQAKRLEAKGGDREAEMTILGNIGTAFAREHHPSDAITSYSQSLTIAQEISDNRYGARLLRLIGEQYKNSGDHNQALKQFNLAVDMSSIGGDKGGAASSLHLAASELATLGYNEQALAVYKRSLSLDQEVGNRLAAASTLADMAGITAIEGDRTTAKKEYEQALTTFQDLHDRDQEATTINALGGLYSDDGDKKTAEALVREALKIRRQMNDDRGVADSLNDLAMLAADQDDLNNAIDLYQQALSLASSNGDSESRQSMYSNLAGVYADAGRLADAANVAVRAVSMARADRLPSSLAHALNMAATIDIALLRFDDAKRSLDEALSILRDHPDPSLESTVLHNLGEFYSDQGYQRKAITYYERTLVIEEHGQLITTVSITLGNIAAAYISLHQYDKALPYLLKALPITRKVRDRAGEVATLNLIGECLEHEERNAKLAASFFLKALNISEDLHQPSLQIAIHTDLMKHFLSRAPDVAILFGKLAIQDIGDIRTNIRLMDRSVRARITWSYSATFRTMAEMLIKRHRLPEAEAVLDQLKSEELQESTRHHERSSQPVSALLALNESESQAFDVFKLAYSVSAKVTDNVLDNNSSNDELGRSHDASAFDTAETRELESIIYRAVSIVQARMFISAGRDTTRAESVRNLEPGILLLYTLVGSDDVYILVNARGTITMRTLGVSPATLSKMILSLRGHLTEGSSDSLDDLKDLGRLVLSPIDTYIESAAQESQDGVATLLWSLDGVLRYIPVGALYDHQQYLLQRARNVTVTPDSWNHIADHPLRDERMNVLAFGLSESYLGLPPLKNVSKELAAVVRNPAGGYPSGALPGKAFLNSNFTLTTFERELRIRYAVIHIASHFVFEFGHSDDSYLLLSGDQTGGTGFKLTVSMFQNDNKLSFDGVQLVTLSACSTGEADTTSNGQEMDSLGMVLQRRGAASILATLWKVNDLSTSELMGNFYRRWSSKPSISKAEALRQAQLAMLDLRRNPRFWAPFILIGDYR